MFSLLDKITPWSRFLPYVAMATLLVGVGVQTVRLASVRTSYAEYKASVAEASRAAVVRQIEDERAQAKITQEKDREHQTSMAALRARYDGRLRALTGNPGASVPLSRPAGQFDAAPGGAGLLSIPTETAVALMLHCDLNTQQLLDLQGWIRAQQAIGDAK